MALINDTTLRDGEQAPFVAFNTHEKLQIAELLYKAGADEIEVGIPAMGKKEQEDIKAIIALGLPIPAMSWNRATMRDLEASINCGVQAVDLSIPTSDVLIDVKYKGNKTKLLKNLETVIKAAKDEGLFVCIGGEDASRADIGFLQDVLVLGDEYGAQRFRYCDTVGILTPNQTFNNISELCSLNLLDIEMHMQETFRDIKMTMRASLSYLNFILKKELFSCFKYRMLDRFLRITLITDKLYRAQLIHRALADLFSQEDVHIFECCFDLLYRIIPVTIFRSATVGTLNLSMHHKTNRLITCFVNQELLCTPKVHIDKPFACCCHGNKFRLAV